MAGEPDTSTPREPDITATPVTTLPPGGQAGKRPDKASSLGAQAGITRLTAVLTQGSKTPFESTAAHQATLQVKLIDEKIGFRVFTLRGFTKGEQLYRERIALEATHHAHPNGMRNAYERSVKLKGLRYPGHSQDKGERCVGAERFRSDSLLP